MRQMSLIGGPPGVGKTTLANVIANLTKAEFVNFSAVTSGIKEIEYRRGPVPVPKGAPVPERLLLGSKSLIWCSIDMIKILDLV